MSEKTLSKEYPLHWLIWHNDYRELDSTLKNDATAIESKDPRGRTCLSLAATLGHLESCRVLLRHGACANAEKDNWTVLQTAVATGDPELVQLILQHRDHQRLTGRSEGVPNLLQTLRESPDFYVEMKWEFTSWVPLVSRMCPSDTYKVYKSGSNVRIDTTLLGFDSTNWQRGSRSFIFKGEADRAVVLEVDHDAGQVFKEVMQMSPLPADPTMLSPHEDAVAARLTSPIMTTYLDTDKIEFERNKSGIWGWRSDKVETVDDYECKVFNASNVELVTKTRTEHLTEQDKKRSKKSSRSPLESFLGVAEEESVIHGASNAEESQSAYNPCHISPAEYFNEMIDLGTRDIGRPQETTKKVQKFKATLSLCEHYPLSLQEQVMPIIDLMAQTNAHFQKLKDFITLQLPAGFPVKIEIPLFHVLNAKITFGNINAAKKSVPGVTCLPDDEEKCRCSLDDECFEAPAAYRVTGDFHHDRVRDEDDELLQFAIQQSLMDGQNGNDQVTFMEAINRSQPKNIFQSEEERILQRVLAESLESARGPRPEPEGSETDVNHHPQAPPTVPYESAEEKQFRLAMEMSQREEEERFKRAQEEEEELERILALSLTEK